MSNIVKNCLMIILHYIIKIIYELLMNFKLTYTFGNPTNIHVWENLKFLFKASVCFRFFYFIIYPIFPFTLYQECYSTETNLWICCYFSSIWKAEWIWKEIRYLLLLLKAKKKSRKFLMNVSNNFLIENLCSIWKFGFWIGERTLARLFN